jgi:hypothetical protein
MIILRNKQVDFAGKMQSIETLKRIIFKHMEQGPFQNLIVPQLVWKLSTFYGARKFVTMYGRARRLSLS